MAESTFSDVPNLQLSVVSAHGRQGSVGVERSGFDAVVFHIDLDFDAGIALVDVPPLDLVATSAASHGAAAVA
jgi:hypothetical protein